MNRAEFLYLAPYVLSLLLLAGIFWYALRNRYIRGAESFAWLIAGQTLTVLGFIFELVTPGLDAKIYWNMLQWLAATFLVTLPFLVFAVQVSEYKLRFPSFTLGVILTFLGVFAAFLLTDTIHHLFYENPRLAAVGPFTELAYDFTFVIYIYLLIYMYGANLYGIALLMRRAFRARDIFRPQYLIIAVGFLIPLVLSFLPLVDIQIASQQDLMPIGWAVGSLIAAWGLFHYGLFDIAPLAREQTIAALVDPVIVLDARNRIVDINKAALTLMGVQKAGMIGRTLKASFEEWPALIEAIANPLVQRKEISVTENGQAFFFDVSIFQVISKKRDVVGRVIVMRDVSSLKTLEDNYRTLSQELEQRIKKQTEQMSDTVERYRTIVENHSDFIVRWKPDGTRTFVNEAYCRYWGISYEQALAMNFLFHAVEEDRSAVEEKISRLNSGASDVETETYQVIRPDGSTAWQEWTDKAIRDEWGRLIEIQSVGRDITERRRAEENLNS